MAESMINTNDITNNFDFNHPYSEDVIENANEIFQGQFIELPIEITNPSDKDAIDEVDEDGDDIVVYRNKIYNSYSVYYLVSLDRKTGKMLVKHETNSGEFEIEIDKSIGGIILPRNRLSLEHRFSYPLHKSSTNKYADDQIGDVYMYHLACEDISHRIGPVGSSWGIFAYRSKASAQAWAVLEHLSVLYDVKQKPGQVFEISVFLPEVTDPETDQPLHIYVTGGIYRRSICENINKLIPSKAMINCGLLHSQIKFETQPDGSLGLKLVLTVDFTLKEDYDVIGKKHFYWYATGGMYGY